MNNGVSIQPYAVRNGLILGVISVAITIGLYISDEFLNPSMSWVTWGVSLAITIFFMVQTFNAFKASNEGYMSLGEGFKGGFIMMLVSSLISTAVNYVYMTIVDPTVLSRSMEQQRETMLQNPNMTEEQVDQAMSMASSFTTPEITAVIGIIGALFIGAIISLIMAAILKKDYETY